MFVGGETIKNINNTSGAHVELQRHPGPNPNEKIFNIRGEPSQIQHAIQMICEKAGLPYVSRAIVRYDLSVLTSSQKCSLEDNVISPIYCLIYHLQFGSVRGMIILTN